MSLTETAKLNILILPIKSGMDILKGSEGISSSFNKEVIFGMDGIIESHQEDFKSL